MARLAHQFMAPGARSADPGVDLGRLLSRLQETVLRADADRERRLRTSEYERKRVETNIEYARTLLTRAEQNALGIKVNSRRQDILTDLNSKRELLDQFMERMADLEELAAANEEEDDDNSDGEDILAGIIATPSESMDSRSTADVAPASEADVEDETDLLDTREPALQAQPKSGQETHTPGTVGFEETDTLSRTHPQHTEKLETSTSQTLRARGKQSTDQPTEKATTTSSSAVPANALFGNRSSSLTQTATAEAILDHQRAEQDALSSSILDLAKELKASSQALSTSLDSDKDVLVGASSGLDRNEQGLAAAARRMGMLRRVTEGKGWWGRMILYAWVYGLMVVLVLVVFALPKLRF